MSADITSPAIHTIEREQGSPSSVLVRIAAWLGAVLLVALFALQAYWAGDSAGPEFRSWLPPAVLAAWTTIWTLGGAALLLVGLCIVVASEEPSE